MDQKPCIYSLDIITGSRATGIPIYGKNIKNKLASTGNEQNHFDPLWAELFGYQHPRTNSSM